MCLLPKEGANLCSPSAWEGHRWPTPSATQELFWCLLLSPWHRVRLQRPDIFPSLWAGGGGLGFSPKFGLHLAKHPFSALSALSLTLVLLVA